MPRRRSHIAPLCLALLALAWAQVFGLVRGYVCDCGGEVAITVAEHCHGPHGVACHDQAAVHHQDGAHENLPAGGTTQHHDLLKEIVRAKQPSHSLAVPVPAVMLIAEMPAWIVSALSWKAELRPGTEFENGDRGRLLHWPQVLTRMIAMRI